MKVILSRKGFDSSNGGCASPILPDGTMLSLPIPDVSNLKYSDISFSEKTYESIIENLTGHNFDSKTCHLDPDIRTGIRNEEIKDWKPAFGQTGSAAAQLKNAKVEIGDIFLFFGWFRGADDSYNFIRKKDDNNFYHYGDIQAIYGYLQIGEIITSAEEILKYCWHPHSEDGYGKNNTLYIPSERLIIEGKDYGPGYGTFNFNKKRILTKENCSRSNWNLYDFMLPDKVYGNRKNSSKKSETLSYRGIWQELIISDENNPGLVEWIKEIIAE